MFDRNLVVLFMDNIQSNICYKRDTTLLLGKEAQKRGYDIIYVRKDWLTINNGELSIYGKKISLMDESPYFKILSDKMFPLDFDKIKVMLLRQNPPFDVAFNSNLHFLKDLFDSKKVCMVVNPNALINFNEKLIPFLIKDNNIKLLPSLFTSNLELAYEFLLEHKRVVLKPMHACSGMGVITVSLEEKNLFSAWSLLENRYNCPIIVQKFIPNDGDKRIIISNGKIVSQMKRVPADFDFRSNLCLKASEKITTLNEIETNTSLAVAGFMKQNDILWSGIDLINEYLIEVNITSPTGLVSMNNLYHTNLEYSVWNDIENYVENFYRL